MLAKMKGQRFVAPGLAQETEQRRQRRFGIGDELFVANFKHAPSGLFGF